MTTKPIATIKPIELDRQWFVISRDIDNVEVRRRGPFANAKTAKATAEKLIRAIMDKQPGLRVDGFALFVADPVEPPAIPLDNDALIEDLARFSDGTLSEEFIRRKYQFGDAVWTALGENDALVEQIEARKIARIRSGATKREKAQQLVVAAPDVMSGIMLDAAASPRHRVDAAKTLDQFATSGSEAATSNERFVITINLGDQSLHFDKSIAIDANDVDPFNDTSTAPHIAAIAAKKSDGSDGQGHL